MSNDNLLRDLIGRGYHHFKNGRYEEARSCFEEAKALEPQSAEAHAWLAAVYGRKIEAAWSLTDKIKLLSILENELSAALEIDSSLPLVRRMHGAKLLNTPDMLGGDPAKAAEEFLYCINQGMDEAEVWALLAECYMKTEELPKAVEALKMALSREPLHSRAAELLQQAERRVSKE